MPATSSFIKLTAQKIGEVKGTVRLSGHDNAIKLIAVRHEIVSPRDIATGLPSGKRQHHPITITKEVDNTTPLLNRILAENLMITKATIIFLGTDANSFARSSAETELYSIILQNASISRIETILADRSNNEKSGSILIESISLSYSQIEWVWKNGGISATDKLNAGV